MCIFCRIALKELPASIVYEDDNTMAFLDIQPINPGHVLVIPKSHAARLIDLPENEVGHLMQVGLIIDKALRKSELQCEGVNLVLADGRAAGQDVDHVHLHVLPRFEQDGVELRLDPSLRGQPHRDQLDEDARKIREAMKKIDKGYSVATR